MALKNGHNKKILIVEDERQMYEVLVDKFTMAGFSVVGASNGEEGLSQALKERPDVILLDIIMPVLDGISMMRRLRESDDEWAKNVPMLILTNLSTGDALVENLPDIDPSRYFVKSDWRLEDIVKKVFDAARAEGAPEGKSVLIVEDESAMAGALQDKLAREGFKALVAKQGEEGLRVALKEHPAVILLDLVMPVMDGVTMLKKLREDEWGKTVPVIILTNLNLTDEMIDEVVALAPAHYFVKSNWKIADVIEKVSELLQK